MRGSQQPTGSAGPKPRPNGQRVATQMRGDHAGDTAKGCAGMKGITFAGVPFEEAERVVKAYKRDMSHGRDNGDGTYTHTLSIEPPTFLTAGGVPIRSVIDEPRETVCWLGPGRTTDDGWRRWLEEHSRTIYPHSGTPVRFRVEIDKSVTTTVRDATRWERLVLWAKRVRRW